MLRAIADLATDHPRRVVAAAVAFAVAAGALGGSVADRLDPYGADDPASESVQARDRMEAAAGADPDPGIVALVRADGPIRSRPGRERVARVASELRAAPEVAEVEHDPSAVSRDGRATYLLARFRADVSDRRAQDAAEALAERLEPLPGVTVGGDAVAAAEVNATVERDLRRAELYALPLLFVLSLIFFRSAVAALLPLLVGGLAIVGTFLALRAAAELTSISVFALNLTTALGLGLAIDYSLFVVSRYREEIARIGPGRQALRATLSSAGRTVVVSALTVAAALAALLTFPQRFLYSMGLGGMVVALVAAAAALVVLPAVLALLGARVNSLSPAWLRRAAQRDARPAASGGWYRLSRFVMRRPGRIAAVSAVLLIALGLPFLGIKFVTIDASVLPEGAAARQVEQTLRTEFPPNRTVPLEIVADVPPGPRLTAFAERVERLDGVAAVAPAEPVGRSTSLVRVVPAQDALSDAAQRLVADVRALDPPFPVLVGGESAEFADLKASLADHLPLMLAVVVGATFLVLFLFTGSVVLPVKAALMNLLTISVAFGALVLIFQDGRLEGLLGYDSQGGIEATMPLLLFAVAFGLSTDYAVFLLSRIKEARDAGAGDSESVAIGLERTGRIVTAAALLFSVAIGALATSEIVFIKQNGVGTAIAVLVDASIVRALLVPSLMQLLGRWNWWAPPPLRRLHARIGLGEEPAASRA